MSLKRCTKCGQDKPATTEFFGRLGEGFQSWCKLCKSESYKENKEQISAERKSKYREKNPLPAIPQGHKKCGRCGEIKPVSAEHFGKSVKTKDGFKHVCKECRAAEYQKTRDIRMKQVRDYYRANKSKQLETTKRYKQVNRQWYLDYGRKYYKDNAEQVKATSKKNAYSRIEKDPAFKLLVRCRTRIYKALKGYEKPAHTAHLIGCSIDQLVAHLEGEFQFGMSWANYGKWHVDHIRPCASYDFTDTQQVLECFHYTDLQPLWAEDNIRKSDRYEKAL